MSYGIALAAAFSVALPGLQGGDRLTATGLLNAMKRSAAQATLLALRGAVDLTYERLAIDPRTGDLVLDGLTLYPLFDWDQDGACVIEFGRIGIVDGGRDDRIDLVMEAAGAEIPGACFEPQVGEVIGALGYGTIQAETVLVDLSYDLGSAGAEITLSATVAEAGDLTASADFEYLWLTGLQEGEGDVEALYPAAWLSTLDVTFENRGIWEALVPLVEEQGGSVTDMPRRAGQSLLDLFRAGGAQTAPDAAVAFAQTLATELQRFVEEPEVLTLRAAPTDGVWLDEETLGNPAVLLQTFQPTVKAGRIVAPTIIPPDELREAVEFSRSISEDRQLQIGRALIEGVGAPKMTGAGRGLLAPLAEAGNGPAALMLAASYAADGDLIEAYPLALTALAAGETGAMGLADEIEAELPVGAMLEMQRAAVEASARAQELESEAKAAAKAGDVPALRRIALDAERGRGLPRSYEISYLLATLASAAGDKVAARLRDRLDQRLGGAGSAAWRERQAEISTAALATWTDGGLAEALLKSAE